MAERRFKAKLGTESGRELFFEVPFDVKAVFGRARAPVVVTLGKHSYRSTVSVYGGRYYLPVRKSNRDAAGVAAGQTLEVRVALDEEPRTVAAPPELAAALKKDAGAKAAWDALSVSRKRELADPIAGAKRAETKARNVAKAMAALGRRAGR